LFTSFAGLYTISKLYESFILNRRTEVANWTGPIGLVEKLAVGIAIALFGPRHSPPREEGWLRHQENFGEAHLSAADGEVAHAEI